METITEDYVSFETAKLLKEKGFNIPVRFEYHQIFRVEQKPQFHRHLRNFNGDEYRGLYSEWYSAPTLQMAMKWLRYRGWTISIYPDSFLAELVPISWSYKVWANAVLEIEEVALFHTYEEACESAIKYCLENLI